MSRLVVVALVFAGCQSGSSGGSSSASGASGASGVAKSASSSAPTSTASTTPPGDWQSTPYGRDVEKLCNAEKYSGALDQPEGARPLTVAKWLGTHMETEEIHQLLVKIQPLQGAAKAAAIQAEADKFGLTDCPLARAWK